MADLSIKDVRAKFPDYNDLSDQQLADALHGKFYSDMPKDQFYGKIGFTSQTTPDNLAGKVSELDFAAPQPSVSTPPPTVPPSPMAAPTALSAPQAPGAQPQVDMDSGRPLPNTRPQTRPFVSDELLTAMGGMLDTTDEGRAARGFGRTAYLDGLVDAPNLPQPSQPLMDAPRAQPEQRQPIADMARRGARGLTEIFAAPAEAAAIAGAGNPNAAALVAQETVQRAQEQIALAKKRYHDNPDMSEEQRAQIDAVVEDSEQIIAANRPLVDLVAGDLTPEEASQALRPDADQRPLYQRGQQVREASLRLFGTPDPQFDDRFLGKLAEGAGNLAGFVGVTLLTGPIGGAATGSALNTSGMYRRAKQEGATEEQARTAAYIGSLVGASEVLPISRALGQVPSKLRDKATTAVGKRLTNAFLTAGEEGVQEAMVEIANNLTAKGVWDSKTSIVNKDVGEAALIGAILGGGLGAVSPTGRTNTVPAGLAAPSTPSSPSEPEQSEQDTRQVSVPANDLQAAMTSPQEPAQPETSLPSEPEEATRVPPPNSDGVDQAVAQSQPQEAPGTSAVEAPAAADDFASQFEALDEIANIEGQEQETGRKVYFNRETGEVISQEEYDRRRSANTPKSQVATPEGGGETAQTKGDADENSVPETDAGNAGSDRDAAGGNRGDGTPGDRLGAGDGAGDVPATTTEQQPADAQSDGGNAIDESVREPSTPAADVGSDGTPRQSGIETEGQAGETSPATTDRDIPKATRHWASRINAERAKLLEAANLPRNLAPSNFEDLSDDQRARLSNVMPDQLFQKTETEPTNEELSAALREKWLARENLPDEKTSEFATLTNELRGMRNELIKRVGKKEADRQLEEMEDTFEAETGRAAGSTPASVDTAAAEADPNPTDAQKEAGNYKKGHTSWNGLDITIENAKGSERSGTDPDGKAWSVKMPAHYGYIKRTEGADGDHVDVYLGEALDSEKVFIVDQVDAGTGAFDEHKVMVGYNSAEEARSAHEAAFSDEKGADRQGNVTEMSSTQFKEWLDKGDTTKPLVDPKPSQRKAKKKKSPQATEKIEDFGEKISGAQKDKAKAWFGRLNEVADEEISAVPLSKSWPEPDYDELLAGGVDPEVVGFIHAARDEVPNKPRTTYKVRMWTEQVRGARDMVNKLIDGTYSMEKVREMAKNRYLNGILGRGQLYERFGHDVSLKNVTMESGSYSYFRGERYDQPVTKFAIQIGRRMVSYADTAEQAIQGFAEEHARMSEAQKADVGKRSGIKFEIRKYRGGSVTIGRKIGRDWFDVKSDPDWSFADARKYLAENGAEIETEYQKRRQLPPERRDDNEPRVGVDHRNGQDVTPKLFSETFGFRGVQFGTYVENDRRQQDLNQAFDGLMDLAAVIGVPPQALSLNGELGLAFGARGSGKRASAHYEPGQIVINLTKGSGAGSLAHEWWHGLDHYFGRQGGLKSLLLTETRARNLGDGIRDQVSDALRAVMTTISKGEISTRSKVADKRKSKPYFGTMVEMSARSFESYVIAKLQDQGYSNDYLANIMSEEGWNALEKMSGNTEESWPYVRVSEMPDIRKSFDDLFDVIQVDGDNRLYQKHRSSVAPSLRSEIASDAMAELRKELDRIGLSRVRLSRDDTMDAQGAFGISPYGPMDIIIGNSIDLNNTMYHEAIHAMRAMDLFTEKEWSVLESEAEAEWIKRYDIPERYPDLTRDEQVEEAVAEAFADHVESKKSPATGLVVQAFNKIARLLRAVRKVFTGVDAEDVFDSAFAGELAARNAETTGFVVATSARSMRKREQKQRSSEPETSAGPVGGDPVHIPDRRVWEELTQVNDRLFDKIEGGVGAISDAMDRARFHVQDRFLPIKRAQRAIEAHTGEKLPEHLDAYAVEGTFSGKAGRHMTEIERDFTEPVIDLIANTDGMTVEMVGDYLEAKHAEERNKRIAAINKDMPDGGSGVTTAEAQKRLKEMENSPQADVLQEISKLIAKQRQRTLDLRVDAGLMTKADADSMRAMYEHYVPLKGFAEVENADASLDRSGVGSKYNIRGPEDKRALGRRSKAFNPLMAAITQAQETAIRAEKNRVARAVYDLASENPSPEMWEVKSVKTKRVFNSTTGMVETRAIGPTQEMLQPNEMAVKVDGEEQRIVLHDPRLQMALATVGVDNVHGALSFFAGFNRYLSMMITTLDPEFMVRNAFRDVTAALINAGADTDGKELSQIKKSMLRNWRRAFMGAMGGLDGKENTEWQKHFHEFEKAGGKVHFFHLESPEAGMSDLDRRVKLRTGPKAIRILKTATSPRALINLRDNKVLGFIERTNMAVDNAVRLAAFVEARKLGWSEQKAANLAKNLTVNFNRRGAQTTWINALFLFFNAAVQGLHTIARAMVSKRGLKVATGLMAYGVMKEFLNAALSEEDEDGVKAYDKIPPYKRRMNDIWVIPDNENAVTIPLPYVYALFPYAGQQVGRVMRGQATAVDAANEVFIAALQQTSPIALTEGFGGFMPTAASLPFELATNEDWLGRPIKPEYQFGDYGPEAYKYYGGVTEASKQISDFLNRSTGGSIGEPGLIDVSPEYIDHTFGFLTGGFGKFLGRNADIATKITTGQFGDIEARSVPVLRQLRYETGPWLDRDRYFTFREQVREANDAVKVMREAGEKPSDRTLKLARLYKKERAAEKQLRAFRKDKRRIDAHENLSTSRRSELRNIVQEKEAQVYLKFNDYYMRVMSDTGK